MIINILKQYDMKRMLFFLCLLFTINGVFAQHYPGGVTGAEVWYKADWNDISQGVFLNTAQTDIKIKKCNGADKGLFNFNPSVNSKRLCLNYNAVLENTTGRNAFFVGEAYDYKSPQSHLGTMWRDDFEELAHSRLIIRNFFNVNLVNAYAYEIPRIEYASDKKANINFYHTNHYNIDKKFKSYGQEGETTFYIGKPTPIDPNEPIEDEYFAGNFPEFISYARELSDNERNRVESYLALKYGLTLERHTSYLNAKNIVFWNKTNNGLFSNRIFGFGRDDISSLNQLQSESTHLKRHLIAAVDRIMETNMQKQEQTRIADNHFLVFGDNGEKPFLGEKNDLDVMVMKKVWLAQRTGDEVEKYNINFKLFLTEEIKTVLSNNNDYTLWLLQDKYIGNDVVSGFYNNQIVYHPAAEVNFDHNFAYFKDVFFDSDKSSYDQFTFGIGPKMIVQVQSIGCEDEQDVLGTITIAGGTPPYHIINETTWGTFEYETNSSEYNIQMINYEPHHITVEDSNGVTSVIDYTPEPWSFEVDLGPDQYLSDTQPEITLDASGDVDDDDAIYQWYLDGVLLPDTTSTLTVTEAGVYDVIVISGDLSCERSDSITISYHGLNVDIIQLNACDDPVNNAINITVYDGVPNYITSITGDNGTVNYAHGTTTTITDIPSGVYTISVTDSVGQTFGTVVDFVDPIELDILSQLEDYCNNQNYSDLLFPGDTGYLNGLLALGGIPFLGNSGNLSLDASALISSSSSVTYQWFVNNVLVSEQPVLVFDSSNHNEYCLGFPPILPSLSGYPVVTVTITDTITNCTLSESFAFKGYCPNQGNNVIDGNVDTNTQLTQTDKPITTKSLLRTTVYPNPSEPNTTFTYRAEATEQFKATVELFTITGARIYRKKLKGDATYTLPFTLRTAGVYLIRTTSSLGVKIDKVIIK